MEIKEKLETLLAEKFPGTDFELTEFRGEVTLKFNKSLVVPVCEFLRDNGELAFDQCVDVTAVDWAKKKNRFTVVYHLFSINNKTRLRVECDLEEHEPHINSVSSIWQSANWYERETWDMYGIKFDGHPDPRRMYMSEEFEYHPLRKEYPLMGIPGDQPLPKK